MSMKNLDPNAKPRKWEGTGMTERVNSCRAMLFLHGFLTEAENRKVDQRIDKWLAMHAAPETSEAELQIGRDYGIRL